MGEGPVVPVGEGRVVKFSPSYLHSQFNFCDVTPLGVVRPCSGLAMGEGPVVPVGEGRVVKFSPSTYIVGLISVK